MFTKLFKSLVFLIVFFISYSLFIIPCFAFEEFETSYQIDYSIDADALSHINQKVFLTNKLTNVYATEYKLIIGSTKINSIKASDEEGKIIPQVKVEENTTVVTLQFNQKVIGKGKTLTFNLNYATPDFATLNGKVLEIGIPKLAKTEELKAYKVRLLIPQNFGKPAFFIPQPATQYQEKNLQIFEFTKAQLIDQGISAAFGDWQILDFSLKYYIENPSVMPAKFQISLPPDTSYQTVYINSLIPPPLDVKVDGDGNWLAEYQLESKESLDIVASGSAVIFMKPKEEFTLKPINAEQYLGNQKYWNTNNKKIIQLAKELKSPKNIYQFVVDNLIYDYGRIEGKVERFGAVRTLNNKESAVCMEFTDLFIALSRAAGIPAREINGYAFTNNSILRPLSLRQDVLHAWPEYYDSLKMRWVPVDPTWGNTTGGVDFFNKLDFNHFAFIIHGLSSEYPLSAGSYKKQQDQQKKDVYIQFSDKFEKKESLSLNVELPKEILAGLPIKGSLIVKNTGNNAVYSRFLRFTNPLDKKDFNEELVLLPPFAMHYKKINLGKTKWYKKNSFNLTFSLGDKLVNHQIEVYPFWQFIISKFIK